MNKKKTMHPILKIILLLFFIYIAFFVVDMSGYYEGKIRNNVELTSDRIIEFEQLVQSGEDIDLESFLKKDNEDYSNKVSRFGEKLTLELQDIVKDTVDIIGDIFKSLF